MLDATIVIFSAYRWLLLMGLKQVCDTYVHSMCWELTTRMSGIVHMVGQAFQRSALTVSPLLRDYYDV